MSSKVSSGKDHKHSDNKPAGGYAGSGGGSKAQTGNQGSKGSAGGGSQQSEARNSGSESQSPDKTGGKQ